MKKLFFALTCLLIFLVSCKKEEAPLPIIDITFNKFTVDANGGLVAVKYQSNYPVEINFDSSKSWISLENNASQGEIQLRVNQNEDYINSREATIRLSAVGNSNVFKYIYITQYSKPDVTPKINAFTLLAQNNPSLISNDIEGRINSDRSINLFIPNIVDSKFLEPTIDFTGKSLTVKNASKEGDKIDFSKTVTYIVENNKGERTEYNVNVNADNGIPMLFIETEDSAPIVSKDYYVKATLSLDGNNIVPSLDETTLGIKGRGNSTWGMNKKPYRIKFDSKQKLAGFPSHKDWVLLANYSDKTSLRTELAFELARNTDLPYTGRSEHLDLYINGKYYGVYQLTEQQKIDANRVNVGKTGYLLEIDQLDRIDQGDVYFKTQKTGTYICIKDSDDVEFDSKEYNWIRDYIDELESALFSDNFADPGLGYAKYMNVDTFIDWYLINEITKNVDASFYSSCYMNITPGGKLSMGPVWDFDLSSGNCDYYDCFKTDGYRVKQAVWFKRLFEDSNFVSRLKERYNNIKSRYSSVVAHTNSVYASIERAKAADNAVWQTLGVYVWPNYRVFNTLEEEVGYMYDFLDKRFEWLSSEYNR